MRRAVSRIKDASNSLRVSGIWAAGHATQTSNSPGGGGGARRPHPLETPSGATLIELSVARSVTAAQPEQHDPVPGDSSEIECPNLGLL
jgi:hypothetical protein